MDALNGRGPDGYLEVWLKMSDDLIDVPARHKFNLDRLHIFLHDKLPGFKCNKGKLRIRQFK